MIANVQLISGWHKKNGMPGRLRIPLNIKSGLISLKYIFGTCRLGIFNHFLP